MTALTLPDHGDNNWDVQINAALFQLEDSINAIKGWVRVEAPLVASAAGVIGHVAIDAEYLYICVDTNTWRRVALAAW